MTFKLSDSSNARLAGVHPTLQAIVRRALEISPIDFKVTEGLRTLERQQQLVADGKSWTMKSRHLQGYAVDLAAMPNGVISWDLKHYRVLRDAMMDAADELRVPLVWGGDWKQVDAVHFELDRKRYL